MQLKHPHILPFLGIDADTFPDKQCMVSLWMEHGTVMGFMRDMNIEHVDEIVCPAACFTD
jgi:hypothetical protein